MFKKTGKNLLFKGVAAALLVGFMSLGLASCEKKDEPTPPTPLPAKYIIKGEVLNQHDLTPLAGVTVTLGTSETGTTDAAGIFKFENITSPGRYNLTFKKDNFFDATYSFDIAAAAPNHLITYSFSISMVPYVEGVTPLDPIVGGVIPVVGGADAELTISAGTVIKDEGGNVVDGLINIIAVETPDIIIGTVNNPGLFIARFEPSGLEFDPALDLAIPNPLGNDAHFKNVQLEFFNESTNSWVPQPQPVTLDGTEYKTVIDHFSIYKLSFAGTRTAMAASQVGIVIGDEVIANEGLTPITVESIEVESKSGYFFTTPVEDLVAAGGFSSAVQPKIAAAIKNWIRGYYGNSDALTELATVTEDVSVEREIQPNYKLVTTGNQTIEKAKFTVVVVKSGGEEVTISVEVQSAGAVVLSFEDVSLDDHGHGHGHGLGGGGTL